MMKCSDSKSKAYHLLKKSGFEGKGTDKAVMKIYKGSRICLSKEEGRTTREGEVEGKKKDN